MVLTEGAEERSSGHTGNLGLGSVCVGATRCLGQLERLGHSGCVGKGEADVAYYQIGPESG